MDCGEVAGDHRCIRYVDWVNISCGAHAGNEETIAAAISEAVIHNKAIGAHPGYPDTSGFGRRVFETTSLDLYRSLFTQISYIKEKVNREGKNLHHVKLHGRLYHDCFEDAEKSETVVRAIRQIDEEIKLIMSADAYLFDFAQKNGVEVFSEMFADRRYGDNGRLIPRSFPGAVLQSSSEIILQVKDINRGFVMTASGNKIFRKCETICVHGDGISVEETLKIMAGQI